MAIKIGTGRAALRAAIAECAERRANALMRKLGIPSRTALLRESRRLKVVHWNDNTKKEYPAQIARIRALDLLCDIPNNLDDSDTLGYCFDEIEETLLTALRRPLTKEEIAGIRKTYEAEVAQDRAERAKYEEEYVNRAFVRTMAGEIEIMAA